MLKKLLLLILLGALVLLTVPPSLAQEEPISRASEATCEADLTGQTVKFYHFGDLSGPYAFITQPVLIGFEDAITYFNEQGGVCGATIATEYRDTGASGEAAQAAWDEFTGRGDASVVFLYLTEDSELLRDQATQQQIPLVVATASTRSLYGENADTPAYVFGATPLYQNQLGAFCDYISQNWDSYGIEGDPVIGHISWLGAFGEASDTEESRAYCASKGVGYANAQYYFPGIPDISGQIRKALDEGANILYTTSLASGPAQLASTVQTLELQDQIILAGPNWVLDTSVIGLGGEAVAGFIGQMPYYWWDEQTQPGVKLVNDYWVANRLATASDPAQAFQGRNIAYLLAWTTVAWYQQFMTLAVNQVGGLEGVDGQAVYETLTSGITFDPLDGLIELRYDDFQRTATRSRIGTIRFVETDGGRIPQVAPLTDWFTVPDLIPGGADVP
jgi:ABC-type branched-subunit amino acid transport system substrate-binding protein